MSSRTTKWRGNPNKQLASFIFAAATSGLPRRRFATTHNDIYAFSKTNFSTINCDF
ncbi:hypothetical protein [Candidatus Tisiphia endosymbiont of Oplodontha viridula]|uniref:hypothetical protein n=1 Tax=Candidatus Tisiphia endosymbiont of Oplodontha viridula TaxID=3077925 RepID=UPI0035C9239E